MIRGESKKKSSLVSSFCVSCFCSDFFPWATNLQIGQGCLPSNVLTSASLNGSACE